MQTNALSAFGRVNYYVHALTYPLLVGAYVYGYSPWSKKQAELKDQKELDEMIKAKKMDPDLFNPFTPIPWHNNPELKYQFANINMRNYVDEHHLNVDDYIWKSYHNSYDHGNNKTYLYNWTSV